MRFLVDFQPVAGASSPECIQVTNADAGWTAADATETPYPWDTVSPGFPVASLIDYTGALSGGKLTIPRTGLWHLILDYAFQLNPVGSGRGVYIHQNGTTIAGMEIPPNGRSSTETVRIWSAGDVIDVSVYQDSGGPLPFTCLANFFFLADATP